MSQKIDVFSAYSRYYDLLYKDKDYAGEAAYILGLLYQHGMKQGDLLEFGSGTGKHARLLVTQGYTVHGVERSADMVAQADLVPGFTCQQGDICEVQLGRRYAAVLSLFHVVSYQVSNSQLQAVFKNAAAHLEQGGLFIFDFWYTPAVYAQQPSIRIKRMADDQVEITRIAEPEIYANENRVDVNYTIYARSKADGIVQILQERHPMRHLSLPEIDLLAQMVGLKRIDAEEFLTNAHPSPQTWGVCVTLQKV